MVLPCCQAECGGTGLSPRSHLLLSTAPKSASQAIACHKVTLDCGVSGAIGAAGYVNDVGCIWVAFFVQMMCP